jgi:chromosomal replication initiation ATPase DnaA
MTAYPFSGTIRNDLLGNFDNDHELSQSIIERYCDLYNIDPIQITVRGSVWVKKRNGVKIDMIRMALSYYLRQQFNIPYKKLGPIIGYSNHTTPIKNRSRIEAYIKNEDPVFYPYWEKLLQVA